ncbi:hypothetical protein LSM04_000587 [Trypanosoma melophagium]|uniref:uncharacterized protein n=1 Tax=Trypanosoma melophagium TaxID=715481 RepID=UPI00351A54BF|nr:hypothetical protein LSM04_000587 [Trypanosoma melophagium]
MTSRRTTLTFLKDDDANGQKRTGSSSINYTTSSPVEINPMTKSLYLTVATGRAFPYVAQWFHDKSTEMQKNAQSLEEAFDGVMQNDLNKHHKDILQTRAKHEKERNKLLRLLQELQLVRHHQRSSVEAWIATFQAGAAAYMAALHEMEETLLHRVQLAENWTLRGERDEVLATLTRLQENRRSLQERVNRDIAKETARRDQTLQHIRTAMETLVGKVGDAVTWEIQRRLLGYHNTRTTRRRHRHNNNNNNNNNKPTHTHTSMSGTYTMSLGMSELPEDEVQLLQEEWELQKELRLVAKRRMIERQQKREQQLLLLSKYQKQKQHEDKEKEKEGVRGGEKEGLQTSQMEASVLSQPTPSIATMSTTTNRNTTETTSSGMFPPITSTSKNNKNKENKEEDGELGSLLSKDESDSNVQGHISGNSDPILFKLPVLDQKEEHEQEEDPLPQKSSARKTIPSSMNSTSGNNVINKNKDDNDNNITTTNKSGRNNKNKNKMAVADTQVPHTMPNPPKPTICQSRKMMHHRHGSTISRPPIVLPPNDTSRRINGRPNPDHLATLLAALTEDTAHFAVSREKTQSEVETLRGELRKQQAETSRLLETNISLEAQRAQLIVQRDAQAVKLASTALQKSTQAKIREVDDQLLNEKLVQMLEVFLQQKEQRRSEIAQVRAAIADTRRSIEKREELLLQAREYWRRNAAATKRVKNAAGRRVEGRESVASGTVETSMTDVPSTILGRLNTTAPPTLLSSKAAAAKQGGTPAPSPTGRINVGEGKGNGYLSIPALGLKEPDEVAEFIYSVFEELGTGSTVGGNEGI